ALSANEQERRRRETLMDQVLARTSWDATARSMNEQIELAIRRNVRASARSATRSVTDSVASAAQRTPPVLVAGAGPTGLSAAYHLGEDALLFEKADSIGGWCRSIQVEGFTFDYAGHIMFSKDPYVHEMYAKLLGDNVHWQDREAWVYSKN